MTISDARDSELRLLLAALYRDAPQVVAMDADADSVLWRVHSSSIAAGERGVITGVPGYLIAEVSTPSGMNLALTQARSLLDDAAACFGVLAIVTERTDAASRRAAVGPLARSATEKASTACWVLSGNDRQARLGRALLVELDGIAWLRGFYAQAETRPITPQLDSTRERLLAIADAECDGYRLSKKGRVVAVGSEELPSLTARVTAVAAGHAYAEQSVFTHPTGHFADLLTEDTVGRTGLVSFRPRSSLHEEGRLCEPAVLALARAVAEAGRLIGPVDTYTATDWAKRIADTWREWCTENGC